MEDVTHLFNNYRECVRHLWNVYYRTLPDSCLDWDLHDEFDDTAVAIFSSIVLRPLGSTNKISAGYLAEPEPLPGFYVIPNIPTGTPIMINREPARSGCWDHPISTVKPNDVDLRLLRFYDFDLHDYREYQYFEVLIHSSASHPEIVGRAALLEVERAKVMFEKSPDQP